MSKEQPKPSIADFKKEINKTYTGISYVKMRQFYKQYLKLVEYLDTQIKLAEVVEIEKARYATALKPFKKAVILKP